MSNLTFPLRILRPASTGSTAYTITVNANTGGTNYSLTIPRTNALGFLKNDGRGNLSWTDDGASSITAPLNLTAISDSVNGSIVITQPANGAAAITFEKLAGQTWMMGLDAANGSFKLCSSATINANTRMYLDTAGTHFNDKVFLKNYALPFADGMPGQFLRTAGAGGDLYWGNLDNIILQSNDTVETGQLLLIQAGPGDISLLFNMTQTPNTTYHMGIDHTDRLFKISPSNNLGLGTMFSISPSETHIYNTLRIGENTFPSAIGSVGQCLMANGIGGIYWGNVAYTDPFIIGANNARNEGPLYLNQAGSGAAAIVMTTQALTMVAGIYQNAFKISHSAALGNDDKLIIDSTGTKIVDKLTINNYALPTADGTIGQVMQTNGAGLLNWANVPTIDTVILKNGQVGPLQIGTTDASLVCIGSNGIGRLQVAATGEVAVKSTTASTSKTTGALTVAGGVGIAGRLSTASAVIDILRFSSLPIKIITVADSPYTVVADDCVLVADTSAGSIIINLESIHVYGSSKGRRITVINSPGSNVASGFVVLRPFLGDSVITGIANDTYAINTAMASITLISVVAAVDTWVRF